MSYKVLIVEDEIVTREGIRDNVDWQADGFELCGDAPDGEMALPLVQTAKPDVLITDIKMPFMDGLQLSKIVRERMPQTKIVILSGHDEFEYAQQAIQLGVTEYLLKPVTVQDMHNVLQRVASKIKSECAEQEKLQQLKNQVMENRAVLRERLLFKLLVGGISLTEAIDQSELLGLDLVARCYVVVLIRIALNDSNGKFDYSEYQRVQGIVSDVVGNNPDVFVIRKDVEELVLIFKGNTSTYLQEDRDYLLEQIQRQVANTRCKLIIGIGAPQMRMADIGQSFLDALGQVQRAQNDRHTSSNCAMEPMELLKVDKSAVEDYLKCGVKQEFDDFFNSFLCPLGETALRSTIVKNYVLMDLMFTTAHFIQELGGDVQEVLPELDQIEAVLAGIQTIEQWREHAHRVLDRALEFRDCQSGSLHAGVILQAKEYIERHYRDAEMSLQSVARQVGHSPSHFSTVFGEETGKTFKEYLTETRIKRAKELLRTTTLRSSDVADQVGFNDAHYFSLVFRKCVGMSPKEFRLQTQQG